jgi:hypoxia up-regulated 1
VKREDIHKIPFSERIHSKATLQKWDDIDSLRINTQNAKNELESYIFQMRELLYDETFVSMSLEEERELISTKVTEASEWLENEGETTTLEIYKAKKSDLESYSKDINIRMKESTARPEAIQKCLGYINVTRDYLPDIIKSQQVTVEEVSSLLKICDEIEAWIAKKYQEQNDLELYKNPTLTASMIDQKCSIVGIQLKVLSKRPYKPKEKKPTVNKTEENTNTNTDNSNTKTETQDSDQDTNTEDNTNTNTEENSNTENTNQEPDKQPKDEETKENHQDL